VFNLTFLREKLNALDSKSRKGLLVFAAIVFSSVAWLVTAPAEHQTLSQATPQPSSGAVELKPELIFVHVAGRVKVPGVYSAPKGSRLYEIVALAGGFSAGADQSSINLARTVEDGEQISVLKVGDALSGSASSAVISGVNATKINLNRATPEELDSLPGVGPKLAARIIDWRAANGGFNHYADLLEVGGIGDKLYASIKPMVVL
jgi:competence protein ComEA